MLGDEIIELVYRPDPESEQSCRIRVTSRARTWRDLAASLGRDALVAAGDHLVRVPREWAEGRSQPWCTPEDLLAVCTGRHTGKLRTAAALVRIGADSPQETAMRLAFDRDGLPEPELNVPILDRTGRMVHTPDWRWPEFMVTAEYDSNAHHSDPRQAERDIERAIAVEAAGWDQVRLSAKDAEQKGSRGCRRVRAALEKRGWRG